VGYDKAKRDKRDGLLKQQELTLKSNNGSKDKAAWAKATAELESFEEEMYEQLRRDMDNNKEKLFEIYQVSKARVLRSCLQKLVDEVRGSQIYVDRSGVPTMRRKAKSSLRKLDV